MTPLGLHHIMAAGHHYGPGPWVSRGRADWTSVYYHRADSVRWMQETWNSLEDEIDRERFLHVTEKLKIQEENAVFWRNACLLYFQTFSKRSIPEEYEKPDNPLEYYINFRYRPAQD